MTILEALRLGPLLADGAMGTELQNAGLEPGDCGDLWNVVRPAAVEEIHRRYVDAGAQLITTNTFGANRIGLARYDAADRAAEVNRAGAEIARRAAGERAWVLGDIGPMGAFIAPLGEHAPDDVYIVFHEQAEALRAGGVDAIIVETMTAVDEVAIAVRAARSAGVALVIATMAFDRTRHGPRTMMGVTPEQAAAAMLDAGATIIGANCGASLDISDFVEIVQRMRAAAPDAPIIAQPNAGQPRLRDDGAVGYPMVSSQMADAIRPLLEAGATIVGGCCGTTPEHIRNISTMLAELR